MKMGKAKRWRLVLLFLAFGLAISALPFRAKLQRALIGVVQRVKGRKSVADRVVQFGPAVRSRLAPDFQRIGVAYPPTAMILVGLKHERQLEVWVSEPPRLLKSYPILGASGTLGPKLKEGDRQVPEGLYQIESLNPNSLYHLSLRVNYPNAFDRAQGVSDGRTQLGSDIMIHGKRCSIGCLAMGDAAAEELFVLAAETGIENIEVILSPVDFRVRKLPADMPPVPAWVTKRYETIQQALKPLVPNE